MNRRRLASSRRLMALLLLLPIVPAILAGQVSDPKSDFAGAFAQFSLALDGSYGDEGPRILSSLESMDRGLLHWDATIRAYEDAVAAEIKGTEPKLAALARLALGGVYLDRYRVADAIREFSAAAALDPARADSYSLQGLANSQPLASNPVAAIEAFTKASALDSTDVVRAYMLARQLADAGRPDEAQRSSRLVVANQKRHAGERTAAVSTHFMRFGIVEENIRRGAILPRPPTPRDSPCSRAASTLRRSRLCGASLLCDVLVVDQENRYGMRRADGAFREGSIDTAVKQLEAAMERTPERPEQNRIIGLVYAADGQYERATAELTSAVRLGHGDERGRLALADVLIRAEQYPAAEQALRETIERIPASGRAHYTLARLCQRQGATRRR